MRFEFGRSLALILCAFQLHHAAGQAPTSQTVSTGTTQSLPNRGCGTPTLPTQFETWLQSLPQPKPGKTGGGQTQSVFNIPVIVHVVHNNQPVNSVTATSGPNLNAAQIYDQINILNRDFNAQNSDTSLVPAIWKPLIGKFQFNFCLAVVNPTGGILAEPGIDRINSVAKGWSAGPYTKSYVDNTIKAGSIWDPTKYLNMWVLNLGSGLLGYATFPNPGTSGLGGFSPPYGSSTTDGLVMLNESFGSIGTAVSNTPYHLGRTTVHELGHWLGLRHIWGDGTCATDHCSDTPPAQTSNFGCQTHPYKAGTCTGNTTGEMFMNYMDYSDDACLYMFTNEQKRRAQLIMTHSSMRASLLTSTVCNLPSAINEVGILYVISPTFSQVINCTNAITPSVVIHNFGSNTVTSATYSFNISGVNTQTFTWLGSLAPNASATLALPQVINIPNGTHTYNVGFYNPNGSADTYTVNNINNQQFSVIGSYSLTVAGPTISCAGAPLSVTASAAASTGFTWYPGNITGSVVTFTPSSATEYTVYSYNGTCFNSRTHSVSMLPSPTVNVNSPTVCIGDQAVLNATGACTYTWLTSSASGSSFVVTPTATSSYTLLAEGCNGCTVTKISTVTVNQLPPVNIIVAPGGSLCAGGTATLTASGAGSYSWNTGSSATAIVVSPTASTAYTVTGATGSCSLAATATVNVGSSSLNLLVSPNPATVCAGGTVNLTATGATSYTWSDGSSGNSVNFTPASATVITVQGVNGACTASASVNVSVISNPAISIGASPSTSACMGSTVQLNATGADTYTWNNAVTGSVNTVQVSGPASYTVTGTQGECVSTQTVGLTVSGSTLGLMASAIPSTICPGGWVTLSASGISSYTWNGSSTPGSTVVSPGSTTMYTLTGNDGPCFATATIAVTVIPAPAILLNGHNTIICEGKTAVISAAGPYSTYNWLPGSITGTAFIAAPAATTGYTVTGTGAPGGCSTSTVFQVNVSPAPAPVISTSNTPCDEPCEGAADAIITGGPGPYTFSITGAPCTALPCFNLCPDLYTLHITDAAGCESSTFFSIECYVKESLNEITRIAPRMYPNPTSDVVYVELEGKFSVQVINQLGEVVREVMHAENQVQLELGELARGIYLVMIRTASGIAAERLIRD